MRQYNDFDPVVHLLALKVVAPNFGKRLEVDFFQKVVFKSQNLKKKKMFQITTYPELEF